MLLGQQLVDTAYVMQTRRGRDAALGMITKYLPFLDCVHCLLCLGITRHGDFCDVNTTRPISTEMSIRHGPDSPKSLPCTFPRDFDREISNEWSLYSTVSYYYHAIDV